ncbi:MAG: peptide chain release factor N(5)-glutamine methyltransferase [Thermodesulfobacteriota bacterium]
MILPQAKCDHFQAEPRTIKEALVWGVEFLRSQDIPEARLSAEVLLGNILGLDRSALMVHRDQPLDSTGWRAYKEKIGRRANQEPVAYLTGQKEFWSRDFQVNPEVLIPRPETELLVETALNLTWPDSGLKTMVELGTGSGAIAVTLAKSIPEPGSWRILATDISSGALKTARENARSHGVEEVVKWVRGNWLAPFSCSGRWIDLLLSNPPYIFDEDLEQLPATVRQFEPLAALKGGPDGLEAIRAIFNQAVLHLKLGGWLVLEIGEKQGEPVGELAERFFFNPVEILKDYAGKDRALKACYHG